MVLCYIVWVMLINRTLYSDSKALDMSVLCISYFIN